MIRPIAYASLILVGACSTSSSPETRPDATRFTCPSPLVVTRYRIDRVQVPVTLDDVTADALDVIGDDDVPDNELGAVFRAALDEFKPEFQPVAASNAALAGAVDWEIETDACPETGEVRVHVGTPAQLWPRAGGLLADGALAATHGCGSLPLGTLAGGAEPGWVVADQMAVRLTLGDHELTGFAGFALDAPHASDAIADAFTAFLDGIAPDPAWASLVAGFDLNGDGVVTPAELQANALYASLLAPEETPDSAPVHRPAGDPVCPAGATDFISFGLAIHATQVSP